MWEFILSVQLDQWLMLLATLLVATAGGWTFREWAVVGADVTPVGAAPIFRSPDHDVDPALGGLLLERVLDARWIHRRVERISFVDEARVTRHLSLDLEMPAAFSAAHHDEEYGRSWAVIPLALLKKREALTDQRVLRNLDVRDESGGALPLLSHYENALAAWSTLAAAVSGDGSVDDLSDDELTELWEVAAAPASEALGRVKAILDGALDPVRFPQLASVGKDPVIGYLLKRFAVNYLLLVELGPTPAKQGRRRIVKVAYDDDMPRSPWQRLRRGPLDRDFWNVVGLLPKRFTFDLGTPLPARGVHCAVEVPGDVIIVRAELEARAPLGAGDSVVRQRAVDNRLIQSPHLAHMHLSGIPLVADLRARVLVRSQASLPGSLAITAPIVLAAGLWFGANSPEVVVSEAGYIQSLLLLIPGVMAGLAFAHQRNHLLARLTVSSRVVSAVVIGVAIASVTVLATLAGTSSAAAASTVRDWWTLFARLSLAGALAQALITLVPWSIRPHRPD